MRCIIAGVGVLRSRQPASLFRAPIDGPSLQPTDTKGRTTLRVQCVLSCPLWPRNQRMCVIAKETGQSTWARTCRRTSTSPKRLHFQALRSLCLKNVHVRKPRSKKSALICPEAWLNAPPGARHMALTQQCLPILDRQVRNEISSTNYYLFVIRPTTKGSVNCCVRRNSNVILIGLPQELDL